MSAGPGVAAGVVRGGGLRQGREVVGAQNGDVARGPDRAAAVRAGKGPRRVAEADVAESAGRGSEPVARGCRGAARRQGGGQVDDVAKTPLGHADRRQSYRAEEGIDPDLRDAGRAREPDHVRGDGRPTDEPAQRGRARVGRYELAVLEIEPETHAGLHVEIGLCRVVAAEDAVGHVEAFGVSRGNLLRHHTA